MQRPAGATLPVVRIVDMRHERSIDNRPIDLSRPLIEGLTYRKSVGEQAVILLNRRGWGSATGCACGYTAQCPSCVIPLTAHKTGKVLKCHRCGYEEPWNHCPWCGKEIAAIGLGTQRLASMVERLVPGIRVGRLDADTGAGVKAQRIIAAFAAGDIDVLIGTQMIAKGLDIPNVTMAAMIRADASLDEESTHSWERAWSLMIQVSGRAGRSSRPGEVIIQTIAPDHPAIVSAKTCDYQLFYKADAQRRKAMRRAPFFHECVIRISTRHEPTSHLLVSKVHGMGDLVSDGVWGGEHRFSAWASFATRHERTAWMDRWMAWYQKQSDAFKRVVRCTPHVDPRD
jgi:primosomal protein N' (replication factor Y)